jgi:L-rhamnose isomerase
LSRFEAEGDFTSRLALMEDVKMLPFGAVWDAYCEQMEVPVGNDWMKEVKVYEREVLAAR